MSHVALKCAFLNPCNHMLLVVMVEFKKCSVQQYQINVFCVLLCLSCYFQVVHTSLVAMTEQHLKEGDPSLLQPDEEEIEKVWL